MDKKQEILQILKMYEFGENTKNGDYIRGIKKREFERVADDIVKLFALPIVSSRYLYDDVVITDDDERFFFWEVAKHKGNIKCKATKQEAEEYIKEFAYWQKEESDNIAEGSRHEMPD